MRKRGFTLVELLAAIAIFAVLAGMLFRMVRSGIDIWSLGEGQREQIEKSTALVEQIAADLRLIAADSPPGSPDAPVRLIADFESYDLDGDRVDEAVLQRLRFVRACPEERFDPHLRAAGEREGGTERSSDLRGAGSAAAAPGGLAEVGYCVTRLPKAGEDSALLLLLRAFRTPIGGEESLFRAGAWTAPKAMLEECTVLATNVLYLGFEFWDRDTESFDRPPDQPGGATRCFDSTRAILLDERGANHFLRAKSRASLGQLDDDVFPRRVRITLVLEKDEDESRRVFLDGDVTENAKSIRVTNGRLFENAPVKLLKIGSEWFEWSDVRGDELTVKRAERSTAAVPHNTGARVHVGETTVRIVEIPVYREDWNDP